MLPIRAVLFDMDGTLLDSERYWIELPNLLLASRGLSVPEDLRADWSKMRCRVALKAYLAHSECRLDIDYAAGEAWYLSHMRQLYALTIPAKAGALEFLRLLANRNVPSGVITATEEESARIALKRTGMLGSLRFVYSTFDQSITKSSPEAFHAAAARLGVSARECLVVEDALYAMQSAREAGCIVWAIEEPVQQADREAIKHTCHGYFESFERLLAAFVQ